MMRIFEHQTWIKSTNTFTTKQLTAPNTIYDKWVIVSRFEDMVFSNHLYWSKEFKEWGYVILCIKSVFLGQKHFVYRFVWLLRLKLDTLFLRKNFIQYEQKISPIVGKIGIPFRHLIAKWESNHQMGVGAQPDQSWIKSRKCMHKKSNIV